jgi:hypothetical protein
VKSVVFYDELGRKVKPISIFMMHGQSINLDLEHLNKGIYYLELKYLTGEIISKILYKE